MSDWTDAEDELAKELYFRGSDETTDRIIKSDPLYLQGRAEALEEAARECIARSHRSDDMGAILAAAIRNLIK